MTSPIVSVIIPCYNAEKNLTQCIDSIRRQTLEQIEIICVDDGSTDSTLALLQDYQKKDPRILVIRQKNAGAGAARNVGLDRATGEYLSFLDADDFFEPDMLEKAVAAAEQYYADYIVFRSNRYYPAEDRYEEIPWSMRNSDLPPYMPFSYRQLTDNIFLSFVGWAWDKLFRRSFVLEHHLRFQEQRTTNDMLFVFSALICAKRIAVVQDILAHQRRGSGDTLSVTRERSWHCFYDALLALRERMIQEDVFWELEKDFINYSLHFCLWHLNSLAEPSRTLLKQKLCREWFAELGIADKPESYFWNYYEYIQYERITKKRNLAKEKCEKETAVSRNVSLFDWSQFNIKPEENKNTFLDPQVAYAVNLEFDNLRDQLMQNPSLWEENQYRYWFFKYQNYRYVYDRIDGPLKEEYRNRMGQEFKRAAQLEQLSKDDFSNQEWKEIQSWIAESYGPLAKFKNMKIIRQIFPHIPKSTKAAAFSLLNAVAKSVHSRSRI